MDLNLLRRCSTYFCFFIACNSFVIILQKLSLHYNWGIYFSWERLGILMPIILSFIMIDVTYMLGKRNNSLQRNNIKLQLFDKRYKVFLAIVNAKALITRGDHLVNAFYNANYLNDLGNKMLTALEDLNDAMLVSQTLFNDNIHGKLKEITTAFAHVRMKYYELNIDGLNMRSTLDEKTFNKMQNIIIENATNLDKMSQELCKILPKMSQKLNSWSDVVKDFNDCIVKSKIMDDFDKYLNVSNLDQ